MIGRLVFSGVHFIIQYKSSSDWILRYKVGTLIAYVIRVYVIICLATNCWVRMQGRKSGFQK